MPTKLKTPITVTFYTTENAVAAAIHFKGGFPVVNIRHQRINSATSNGEAFTPLEAALLAQGIDYRTWEPPTPLMVGPHEVTTLDNGGLKVGCTTIDRATIEKLYAKSNEGMQGEWPKYYEHKGRCVLWKAYSETEIVEVESDGKECSAYAACFPSLEKSENNGYRKRLTAAEAAAILKGAK